MIRAIDGHGSAESQTAQDVSKVAPATPGTPTDGEHEDAEDFPSSPAEMTTPGTPQINPTPMALFTGSPTHCKGLGNTYGAGEADETENTYDENDNEPLVPRILVQACSRCGTAVCCSMRYCRGCGPDCTYPIDQARAVAAEEERQRLEEGVDTQRTLQVEVERQYQALNTRGRSYGRRRRGRECVVYWYSI